MSIVTSIAGPARPVINAMEHAAPVGDLLLRLWVAKIFLWSGLTKLQSIDSTIMLFKYEYEVPLLSAELAAYLGTFLNNAALTFFSRLLLALGVIAALSYAWEKYKTNQDLMMTKQEVKDEHKNQEGDAHVKNAMRRMARRLLQKQMLASVATADVVVTNDAVAAANCCTALPTSASAAAA